MLSKVEARQILSTVIIPDNLINCNWDKNKLSYYKVKKSHRNGSALEFYIMVIKRERKLSEKEGIRYERNIL